MFDDKKTQKEPEDIFEGTDEVPPARPLVQRSSSEGGNINEGGTPSTPPTGQAPPPPGTPAKTVAPPPPAAQPEAPSAPPPTAEEKATAEAGQVVLEEPKKSWGRLLAIIIAVIVILGVVAWIALQYSDSIFSGSREKDKTPKKNEIVDDELKVITPTQTVPKVKAPVDSDGDGLTDEEELLLGTDALLTDSDADGLPDRDEVKVYKTDPLDSDTDKDGYFDGEEVEKGYDPKGSGRLYEVPAP